MGLRRLVRKIFESYERREKLEFEVDLLLAVNGSYILTFINMMQKSHLVQLKVKVKIADIYIYIYI